ncbi:MAG: outer membrane protein assembly factor BamC [Methylococcales bacterium]|nr:outer membrane protein assembly factor BamC [Methylococcales bacterium]
MQVIVKILLLSLGLASCGTSEDSRYRDTTMLERPPAIGVYNQKGQPLEIDNSAIPKRRNEPGLGSDVYMTVTTPSQLRIKRPFDNAWNTLGLALKQSDIKITDREHDKGLYYVVYRPDNSFFSNKYNEAIYLLLVEKDGSETKITATLGSAAEQGSSRNRGLVNDNNPDQPADGAEKLLQSLYETIRDDLKEE